MATNEDLNNSLPLPVDKLPECWNKDERMNSLFAQFRNRSVNPQDWDSKYTFWKNMISEWLGHQMRCSFSISDLNLAFKRNGRIPLCLSIVVQELHKNGEIISLPEFLKGPAGTWTGWAIDILVKKPLIWSFFKVKNSMYEQSIDTNAKFVHVKTVKELAEIILTTLEDTENKSLIPLCEVTKNCQEKSQNKHITNENIKLAIIWLRQAKKAAFRENTVQKDSELLVKISPQGVTEVTEVEEGLYKLLKQEEMLTKNLELLEVEKNAVLKNAKSYLASGLRQVAKSCLRKKKELEKSIEKRAAALQNVQILIARIHDAHSDSEVMTSYKTGCITLKKKLEEAGLTEDSVRDTMDDLSEVLEEFKELQTVLSESVEHIESDHELETELAELMASPSLSNSSADTSVEDQNKLPSQSEDHKLPKLNDLEQELMSLHLQDMPSPPKSSRSVLSTLVKEKNPLTS
ncbi:charged multivesicular body protein 7 [Cephus cinctus]|uniref:Charged multivesicular body protein 7 n=1 Tax=Cephus cinctus TaxID=211228 RepID=A0AAJ7FMA2_CEPCN|nr:charged multivesicular body protein 7 [Cephus cinctus]